MSPNPGDIGLVAIRGRVGAGIRLGQWLCGDGYADFEHAFVHVGDGEIVEAMPHGALLSKLSRYDDRAVETGLAWLRCPREYGTEVARAAREMVGVPYSFLDYGAIALHRFRVPAPHLRAYIEASGHQICSQLCDRAAERGGWHLFNDKRWHGYVTPGSLYQLSLTQPTTSS
jgi:hypothetical protein